MIFADKLIDLRKKNGWSQEELAEKLNVSRQAVSKWEGAQSVPDMARIIQLSELFGVSTDYLLKDSLEPADAAAATDLSRETAADSPSRTIGMEEANAFLKIKEENSRRVALGVLLCILSPVALILLGGIHEFGLWNWTAQAATGLGLAIMILMILPAVGLFITSGLRIAPFEHLEKEPVETLYGVSGMVKDRKAKFQPVHSRFLITGILLCIASCIPLFLSLIVCKEDSFLQVIGLAALLALAAIGVMLIVRVSIIQGSYQMLLEEGEYTRSSKESTHRFGFITGAYWCLVTAGYLLWLFTGKNNGQDSWIIWPIAAVAYGAVAVVIGALRKK
jgi:transcriptional regulator with XRE-family HTH domain